MDERSQAPMPSRSSLAPDTRAGSADDDGRALLQQLPFDVAGMDHSVELDDSDSGARDTQAGPPSVSVQERSLKDRSISVSANLVRLKQIRFGIASVNSDVFDDQEKGSAMNVRSLGDKGSACVFPPIYNMIRAGKQKKLLIARMGSVRGLGRNISAKIGYPRAGLASADDQRTTAAQNYHYAEIFLPKPLTLPILAIRSFFCFPALIML